MTTVHATGSWLSYVHQPSWKGYCSSRTSVGVDVLMTGAGTAPLFERRLGAFFVFFLTACAGMACWPACLRKAATTKDAKIAVMSSVTRTACAK
jgi:hypothetical protein